MRSKPDNRRLSFLSRNRGRIRFAADDNVSVASTILLLAVTVGVAQDIGSHPMVDTPVENYQLGQSPLSEAFARVKAKETAPSHFLVPIGSGGLNLSAGLKTEYIDNVFLTESNAKDDFILVPECDLSAFFPIGQVNSLGLDVGLAYYEYLKHSQLNTGTPLVNPNTDLAFNVYSGNFGFRFNESFSYQESPVYESGSEFFNVYNTALFKRYLNRIGGLMTWDQHDLVVTAGYFHENLWSAGSTYNYIDHASELFSADAMFKTSPVLSAGAEAAGSLNDFSNRALNDSWRARVGPVVQINPSTFIKARLGAGYERIEYDSTDASTLGLDPQNSYYAYANVEHRINAFFSHSLVVSHDNQLGYNAGNLEGTHVSYSLSWSPRERLTISPLASVHFYEESFGSSAPPSLYHEKFTYYLFGIGARYQLGKHWRANASWNYRLKDSEIDLNGYAQNQVSLELLYQF
jgi:hypothetical protein